MKKSRRWNHQIYCYRSEPNKRAKGRERRVEAGKGAKALKVKSDR
jgi:hypothetical protein